MEETSERRFQSRWGFWSLDERALRIDTGPTQTFQHLYRTSKPAFAVLVAFFVYPVVAFVLDVPAFFRSLGVVFFGGIVLGAVVFGFARLVALFSDATYAERIATADIRGFGIVERLGSVAVVAVYESDGERRTRPILLPMDVYYDVDGELDRIVRRLDDLDIPIDDQRDQ